MYLRIGKLVSRYPGAVVTFWCVVAAGLVAVAPRWSDVTADGDLAHLPANMPSMVGQSLTRAAFPGQQAKSQIVLVAAREDRALDRDDLRQADHVAARFQNMFGAQLLLAARTFDKDARRWDMSGQPQKALECEQRSREYLSQASSALDEALRLDEHFAPALWNRALVRTALHLEPSAEEDRRAALRAMPELASSGDQPWPADADALPLVDVWTRHHPVFGQKLTSADRKARLVVLHFSDEFMATSNIRVLERVEQELEDVHAQLDQAGVSSLAIGISGSAAVGGDMLRSAAESIRNTEWFTIVLVVTILLLVYRAPVLISVPLVTITLSLVVSTAFLALLVQLRDVPWLPWWNFKVFTTTRIFIVVILFGAGTDFCLFLIARYREHLRAGESQGDAVTSALVGVGDALAGSALTTILGLAMMFFADYGKFRNSGPAIGICLAVTLLACLSLAPALLRLFGRAAFWPFAVVGPQSDPHGLRKRGRRSIARRWWGWLARRVVMTPGRILICSLAAMAPFACVGLFTADRVTFDFLSELSDDRPSRQGTELLRRHFPVGEGGPVVVLAYRKGAGFDRDDRKTQTYAALADLTRILRSVDGVESVRSLYEPLGDAPQRTSLFRSSDRKKIMLREHQLTRAVFLAQAPAYRGDLTRLDVVLQHDPFSAEAAATLERIDRKLQQIARDSTSAWRGTQFVYTGTTAGIRDLRRVTRSDQTRIQILVVIAVFSVLWCILRRGLTCVYLILSVLFSYFVTIGATELFFQQLYGSTFQGLDWKVPLFLFVILVAVGEDYNIYLVTRVFQEQAIRGPFAGLREALIRTGGIITSCGLIMAGTFSSMTSGTLRGIVELGFALSLGVLLDTFIVRSLLVPAFLALIVRWRAARQRNRDRRASQNRLAIGQSRAL